MPAGSCNGDILSGVGPCRGSIKITENHDRTAGWVPSVVYGIFGFFILRSDFADFINPFIGKTLGVIPLFQIENDNGLGIPLAATVLALMILPTVVALAREAMRGVPWNLREGSTALGATKWETIRQSCNPCLTFRDYHRSDPRHHARDGRNDGSRMLVGNIGITPKSFLDVGEPMTAKILLDIGYYVVEPEGRSALFAIGAVLMIIEIGFVVVDPHHQ